MFDNYKIFKCDLCDKNNPCYCMIKQEDEEIETDDLWNCLYQGGAEENWQEVKELDIINIKQILGNK